MSDSNLSFQRVKSDFFSPPPPFFRLWKGVNFAVSWWWKGHLTYFSMADIYFFLCGQFREAAKGVQYPTNEEEPFKNVWSTGVSSCRKKLKKEPLR